MAKIAIDGNSLTLEAVAAVARRFEPVELAIEARRRVETNRDFVEEIVREERPVYGITTGVGDLCNVAIPRADVEALQKNLVVSHAAGVGEPLSEEIVRAMMLLRANALAKGYSGVRPTIIDTLIAMLNRGVYPVVPAKGSVGSSGDLAPLAHISLVMIGEGEAFDDDERIDGADALRRANIEPLRLKAKEGLALLNGTQMMTAIGVLTLLDADVFLKAAQIASAASLEALKGTTRAFDERMQLIRPHPGSIACAANIRHITANSAIIASHKNCEKVQDAYTLRCMPQVYGASCDAMKYVRSVLKTELNAATDNPLIFDESGESISGGNFHGQPLALALDFLGIALAEIGDISERTIDRLNNPHVSGLPPFLTDRSGLCSGYMIAQYTAAALVSENKSLAHPASVDSIPTSAGQEDHVSMGSIAARSAYEILRNVEQIIAIELLCASQGIDFQKPLRPGVGTNAAYRLIRDHVPHLDRDRTLYRDIETVARLVETGEVVRVVEDAVGPLQ